MVKKTKTAQPVLSDMLRQTRTGQHRVSVSGFGREKKELFKEIIEKLHGTFQADLLPDTTVVVGESVLSAKYKEAMVRGVKVLSEEWLYDSKQQGVFMPATKYTLPILKGVNIGILGLSEQAMEKAKPILQSAQATFTTSATQIQNKEVHLVILSQENQEKYKQMLSMCQQVQVTCVPIEWLWECQRKNSYVQPEAYQFYNTEASNRRLKEELMVIQGYQKIFEEMLQGEHEQRQGSQEVVQLIAMGPNECFSQVLLFIHQQGHSLLPPPQKENSFATLSNQFRPQNSSSNLENSNVLSTSNLASKGTQGSQEKSLKFKEMLRRIVAKFIALGGGYVVDKYSPMVTHILVDPVNYHREGGEKTVMPSHLAYYRHMNSNVKVVNIHWVKECFKYRKAMPEKDYPVLLPFERFSIYQQKRELPNETQPKAKLVRSQSNTPGPRNACINNYLSFTQQKQKRVSSSLTRAPISNLFKRTYFIIYDSKSNSDLKNARHQIEQHQGIVFTMSSQIAEYSKAHPEIKDIMAYMVVGDGYIKQSMDKMKSLVAQFQPGLALQIEIVSYRWVTQSLNHKQQMKDFRQRQYFQLLPFNHATPYLSFQNVRIYVTAMQKSQKQVFREIVNILQGQPINHKVVFDPAQLDYVLLQNCQGDKYTQVLRHNQMARTQGKETVKMVTADWLVNSVQSGQLEGDTKYLLPL